MDFDSKSILVLFLLLVCTASSAAALLSSSADAQQITHHQPKRVFQTYTEDLSANYIVTNPRGVGNGSPFILIDNFGGTQAITAEGKPLNYTQLSNETWSNDVAPIMNYDSQNNTLLFVSLQNGLTAKWAMSLQTRWVHKLGEDKSSPLGMMYVEPELADCPSGGGAISLVSCDSTTCTLRLVDVDSGELCGKIIPLHGIAPSPPVRMMMTMFPANGPLKRPVMVLIPDATLYGIDAITGERLYEVAVGDGFDFQYFVPGASPNNAVFAYSVVRQNTSLTTDAYIAFRTIADGHIQLQTFFDQHSFEGYVFDFVWTASAHHDVGGLAVLAYFPQKQVMKSVFVSAWNGMVLIGQDAPVTDNMLDHSSYANVGNAWTMGIGYNSTGCYAFGYPNDAIGKAGPPSFIDLVGRLFKIAGQPDLYPVVGMAPFVFTDGTPGLVAFVYMDGENGDAAISAFTV